VSSASIPTSSIPPPSREASTTGHLAELAVVFLRLGLTSFGGPAAHVALMRDEFVRRRRWLDDAALVDLIGAANLIPGPTSTELAMHIGHRRAGRPGLVVAGLAFLLPAVTIVAVLAWLYVEEGQRPEVGALLVGIVPIVVAIVAHAGWSIGRSVVRTPAALALLAGTVIAALAGVPELLVLLCAGILALVALVVRSSREHGQAALMPGLLIGGAGAMGTAGVGLGVTLPVILVTFLKIGAVLFGSGYVLIALLRSELVEGLGWITERQLVDAVAVGQATPGPLFSTATFLGFVLAGPAGAVVATVGVFLPAFIAVALSIPVLDRLRGSAAARAFLDGVNVAAVGLIALVAVQLGVGAFRDILAIATGAVALALLMAGVGTGRLILAGAAVGLIRLALTPR
jgi:chromate transporter